MQRVVWVIQEGKNDYSPAEEFGEVRFITKGDMVSIPNSQRNKEVEHDVKKFLSEYVAGEDFIVPSGNPIVVALVMQAIAVENPSAEHRVLKWDGLRALYIPHNIRPTRRQRDV